MGIILRVVSAEEGEGAFSPVPVYISDPALTFHRVQYGQVFLDQVGAESRRLPQETLDHVPVVLNEHGGDGVIFGRKLVQFDIERLVINPFPERVNVDV